MSLAENLLNSLPEENESSIMTANGNEEGHIIVNGDRTIVVPNSLKIIATKGDRNVETVTFDCVRYWDGHDLSTFDIYLNYTLPNEVEGTYNPKNIQVYQDHYSFDWTIDENFTRKDGKIKISLMAKIVQNNRILQQWGSFINEEITVAPTLPVSLVEDADFNAIEAKNQAERAANSAAEARKFAETAEKAALKAEESASQALPSVTSADNGKVLVVKEGSWEAGYVQTGTGTDSDLAETVANHEKRIIALEGNIADVLYKQIDITRFTNDIGTVEMGNRVTSVILSWGLNKTPTTLTLDGVNQTLTTNGGTEFSGQNITKDKTYTLRATDERGSTTAKTTSITFLNRIYYGASGTFTPSVFGGELASSKSKTFTVTAGEGAYIWYAVPTRFGTCSFKVGGFEGGFSLVSTESLSNFYGYSEQYYIYRSDNTNLGATTVVVS